MKSITVTTTIEGKDRKPMTVSDCREAAEILKIFANPTRLLIVESLLDGKKCVNKLEEVVRARQANISQHLAVLRHRGIVDYSQEGNLRCYFLKNPVAVKTLLETLARICIKE